MSKKKKTISELIIKYVRKYSEEFIFGHNDCLYCNICNISVDASRKSIVDLHPSSKKHIEGLKSGTTKEKTFFNDSESGLTRLIVQAFASADIPLKKLEN